jgi:hypothetical protein
MVTLKLNKEIIITSVFVLLSLAGYVFFPANGYFQHKAIPVVFLVLLPFLYNKYFLKKENLFTQIKIEDWKNNLKWLAVGLLSALLIIGVIFKYTDLGQHYFLAKNIKNDFWKFLWYELTGVAFTVATYELFFRGFVMNYFKGFLGKWSILIQFFFFITLLLMLFGLPYWFYIVYLIFAPFTGWIAYKSESIVYSFVGQLLFVIIIDATFIALTVK